MARFGDEDLDTFTSDMAVVVTYGSKRTKGHLDEEEEIESDDGGGNVLVMRTVLKDIKTSEFSRGGKLYGLTVNGTITADGTSYTVHDKRLQSDGAFTTLVIAKA